MFTYQKGTRVILARVIHDEFKGLHGTIRHEGITTGYATIRLDDGRYYKACPYNLDRENGAEDC